MDIIHLLPRPLFPLRQPLDQRLRASGVEARGRVDYDIVLAGTFLDNFTIIEIPKQNGL